MLDVLFIVPTEKLDIRQEVNGTLLLATKLLQSGISAQVLRFGEEENYKKDYQAFIDAMVKRILETEPKSVSFYTVWPDYHIMLRLARRVKERCPEIKTILGGPQASATAAATMQAMPFIDCISTGEGEGTVVPFFSTLLQGVDLSQIPGLYYREHGEIKHNETALPLCDLNTLPHWDDRLCTYEMPKERLSSPSYYMPIDAGRGCPYNCTFCCTSHFWRRTYRMKSPERIVEDIRYFNKKFGICSFWFSHDAFTINRKLVEQVCDYIIEQKIDIRWRCSTRIDCITEELVLKMKQAGLVDIEVGIETGSARMQKLTNKRLDLKKAHEKIGFMLRNGIRVGLFFMYGFPEETEEDLSETLKLVSEFIDMGVRGVTMSYTRFNPCTQITEDFFEDLVLDPKIKVLTRGIFGYEEEYQIFAENKAVFPCFYHLNTPVRNEYQYLIALVHLYYQYGRTIRYLREAYQEDDLKLYHDFCNYNADSFAGDMEYIVKRTTDHSLEMLERVVDHLDDPNAEQVRGLLRYDHDSRAISKEKAGTRWEKTYSFSFLDLQRKRPLHEFRQGTTTFLMEKTEKRPKITPIDMT